MDFTVKEELVLNCQKHGQKVIQIVLDNNFLPDDRMLCLECIELSRNPYNRVIGVAQAKEMIKEKLIQQYTQIQAKSQAYLYKLESLKQELLTFKELLLQKINNLIGLIFQWISEINYTINKNKQMDLQKGIELLLQDQEKFNIQKEVNEKAYLTKIYSSFDKLLKMEGIQECIQVVINLPSSYDSLKLKELAHLKNKIQNNQLYKKVQEQVVNIDKAITLKKINQIEQNQICNAIAFNNFGNIMIAGFDGDIKLWEFDNGNITELLVLKGQSKCINCLIYSKRSEWFISGGNDGYLQMWKQGKSNKDLQASNFLEKQISIRCMVLNQQEEQLISCCKDIVVWQVNYEKNQLSYSYTLENKHINWINGLSLNDSDTALVSCSDDKQIILWIKGTDFKWKFQNSIEMDYYLYRICFMNENEFIVQLQGRGYSNVFRIKDKQLQEQQDLQIKLTDKNGDDGCFFPTIYNKKNDVIVQKSSNYVYILRRNSNGYFKVQAQPIDFQNYCNYGSMTQDGQHLVIWNRKTKEFKIYKVNYE